MTIILIAVCAGLIAYGIGSIPFGLLLTKWAGLGDIRAIGSGNIGATNVLRTGKKWLALSTLLLDFGKGFVACFVPLLCYVRAVEYLDLIANEESKALASSAGFYVLLSAPLAVLIGHIFPVWLKFKGGKGVATLFGIAFALNVYVGTICAIIWLGVFAITRISSLSAMFMLIGFGAGMIYWMPPFTYTSILITFLILYKHRENIQRLLKGEEPHFGKSAKRQAAA